MSGLQRSGDNKNVGVGFSNRFAYNIGITAPGKKENIQSRTKTFIFANVSHGKKKLFFVTQLLQKNLDNIQLRRLKTILDKCNE